MDDPSLNPNADSDKRRKLQKALTKELADVLAKHAEPIAAVSEDVPTFFRSLLMSYFIAVYTIQAETTQDETMTVKDHMTNQFNAGKAAYTALADANGQRWNNPPIMKDGK